ncbi:MAG TPA: hypothetical protein VFG18_09225 [Xanthomonadaceae bacterium]|jgi:hypothetical protein|nr:hypothetical protein [Xanthomonadaceae bacterium]
MKHMLWALALAGLVAGCSAQDQPDQAAAPAAGQPVPQALPQGFVLRFAHDFRGETLVAVTPREQRRRVTVEYLEGEPADIVASLADSAVRAGFKSGRWQQAKDGGISFFAHKGGYGQLRAEITPGGRLSHPAARGVVVLGWPVRSRPSAPAAGNGQR